MPVSVPCPQCSRNLNVPDASTSQQGRCPSCGHVFVLSDDGIPSSTPTSQPSAPQKAVTFFSSGIGNEQPAPAFASDRPNEFATFQSTDRAVSAPQTFHMLFRWLVITAILQFFAGSAIFVLAFGEKKPPAAQPFGPSGQVIHDSYLNIGGIIIHPQDLSDDEAAALFGAFALFILAAIAETILFFVLLYKCWALIQDGRPQTTPGKAIGFWFIPLFNLYWIFVAVRGLAEDLNRTISRRRLPTRKVSVGLTTFYCMVKLGSMMPLRFGPMTSFIGYAAISALLLELVVMYQIKNAAAEIAAAKAGRSASSLLA